MKCSYLVGLVLHNGVIMAHIFSYKKTKQLTTDKRPGTACVQDMHSIIIESVGSICREITDMQ